LLIEAKTAGVEDDLKGLLECAEQLRQAIQSDAGACGNFKRAGASPEFIQLVRQLIGQPDHLTAVFVADLPGRVEMDMAEAVLGQRHVELPFEGVERLAGVGRGAAMEAGGVGEALGDRHVAKDPQRIQLHGIMLNKKWKFRQGQAMTEVGGRKPEARSNTEIVKAEN